jgi:hypothetical protein
MNSEIVAVIIAVVGVIGTLSASIASQILGARARREELESQRLQRRDEYDRDQARNLLEFQRQMTVEFILATDTAHSLLRGVAAQSLESPRLGQETRDAVRESGLYGIRERMLVSVPPEVAYAAEKAFHSIVEIRDAISVTSTFDSPAYRDAYNVYAEAIWELRQKARESFDVAALNLNEIREIESSRRASRAGKTTDSSASRSSTPAAASTPTSSRSAQD